MFGFTTYSEDAFSSPGGGGDVLVAVTSLSGNATAGSLITSGTAVIGLGAVASIASIGDEFAFTDFTFEATGFSATASLGTVDALASALVTPTTFTALTSSLGTGTTVTGTALVEPTALVATGDIGSPSIRTDVEFSVTGLEGTSVLDGNTFVFADVEIELTKFDLLSANIGSVSVIGNANVSLTGIEVSGTISSVIVWTEITPVPGTIWAGINPSPSNTWTEISPAASTTWTEIAA